MAAQLRKLTSFLALNRSFTSIRTISRNTVNLEKAAAITSTDAAAKPEAVDPNKLSSKTHAINNFEKRLLVWTGKYKSMNEVPSLVAPESVEKARNKARIRVANLMMILTALACLVMIISGKNAAERGETLQTANLEWHRRINENYESEHPKDEKKE